MDELMDSRTNLGQLAERQPNQAKLRDGAMSNVRERFLDPQIYGYLTDHRLETFQEESRKNRSSQAQSFQAYSILVVQGFACCRQRRARRLCPCLRVLIPCRHCRRSCPCWEFSSR